MALNSTVYKADLHISNMNTQYYQQHKLMLAKHPSETDERLMVRLLAFALYAHESLVFGKGVSEEQEPALWQKDMAGEIELWIEVGLPDERKIRKACGLAKQVVVILYGKRGAETWWPQNSAVLKKISNLTVIQLPTETTQALAEMAARNMQLNCILEGTQISLISEAKTLVIEPVVLYKPAQK